MNEEEKRLLAGYKRLSPRSQHIALAQIIAGAEMEENARRLARDALKALLPIYTSADMPSVIRKQA